MTSYFSNVSWPAVPSSYDAQILALASQLGETQWLTREELEQNQKPQLAQLLSYAREHSPYYRERLQALVNFAEDGDNDLNELMSQLPTLSRHDIQSAGDQFFMVATPKNHGAVANITSSGSTGQPVRVRGTGLTNLFNAALGLRNNQWHERNFMGTLAAIRNLTTQQAQAASSDQAGTWVRGYRSGPAFFLAVNTAVDLQLEWLLTKNPHYLLTLPTNLNALLSLSREIGKKPSALEQVITMGEVVDDALRDKCEEIWDVKLVDSYSSEELGILALQCPEYRHYHAQSESVLLEVLDDESGPCKSGMVGRVVATNLHNFAAPLIRYELGDFAEVGEPCPCGRGLPVLKRIMGRTRNMLHLPDGSRLWPSFPEAEMLHAAPVRQFQIIQETPQTITASIVPSREFTEWDVRALSQYLLKQLRHPFDLKIDFVTEIRRSNSGKYEDFMSLVTEESGKSE